MSIARQHSEWLRLVDTAGPFVTVSTLMKVFPQGLGVVDSHRVKRLRQAYQEWDADQSRREPDLRIHDEWVRFVLRDILDYDDQFLCDTADVPVSLNATISDQDEIVRPNLALLKSEDKAAGRVSILALAITVWPRKVKLNKPAPASTWIASPIDRMAMYLRKGGHKLGLVTNGEEWTLVSACVDTIGTATWHASLWLEEPITLRAFVDLLGLKRFFGVDDADTLAGLLVASADDQTEVTNTLGYQVRRAVEMLVHTFDRIDKDSGRTLLHGIDEKALYQAVLTVMMRLVFLFSAEERELLRLGEEIYDNNYAVSTLRAQLRETADQHGEEILERHSDAWCRLLATFRAVHGGVRHEDMALPAYGGNLFDPARFPFLEGRAADGDGTVVPPPIDNRTVLHLLDALQTLEIKIRGIETEKRRLSFRALDIEQIGHVYEGLLDHTAVRATSPVLGLSGTRDKEPEIPLDVLEEKRRNGLNVLVDFLADQTGRSKPALEKALKSLEEGNAPASSTLDLFDDSQRTSLTSKSASFTPKRSIESGDLMAACGNDALYARVSPFAALIRKDTFGRPVVIDSRSVYVTAGTDRRSTGTHYTPRSLTEPIVKRTLEPVVYRGVSDGKEPSPETLKTPEEIFGLKVCDMTTGSGAFLVEACRYLSARLVEAWTLRAKANPDALLVLPHATPSEGSPAERILSKEPEELLTIARRIIVDRCLYGVDKNPMAVEMAKLSLWLITLERDRPFTFLDHAIKPGDSLVGVDMDQLRTWSMDRKGKNNLDLFMEQQIRLATDLRTALESFIVRSIDDVREKERLHREAEAALARVKLAGDLVVAPSFLTTKSKEQNELRGQFQSSFIALHNDDNDTILRTKADVMLGDVKPFHWPLEFPEVFQRENGGFDAIVGNPPFMGGKKISGEYGDTYREYVLMTLGIGMRGNADIVAYFYLRALGLIREEGGFGLLATNTLAQGDTREVGLDQIVGLKASIFHAESTFKWPGQASLEVALCHIFKGGWNGRFSLDGKIVESISPYLGAVELSRPRRLISNASKSFQGSIVLGMGFVLTEEEAVQLLSKNTVNSLVVFPYLNGEDVTTRPDQSPSRWVINFFDRDEATAADFTEVWEIIQTRVRPERQRRKPDGTYVLRRPLPDRYWQYADKRPALYNLLQPLKRVLVVTQTAKYHNFVFVPNGYVYGHKLVVFPTESFAFFAVVSSAFHQAWVLAFGSTLETRPVYTPSDCFETFPFPTGISIISNCGSLDSIGIRLDEARSRFTQTHQVGLTKTYNLFHDPLCRVSDIDELHRLPVEMDNAVSDAYGWMDLDLFHDFYGEGKETRFTISPQAKQEVLRRLLKLNHERAAEEKEQLERETAEADASRQSGSRRAKKAPAAGMGDMFDTADGMSQATEVRYGESVAPINLAKRNANRDPQLVPWPGREEFMYQIIPQLVALRPGERFDFYRRAATFAAYPTQMHELFLRNEDLSRVRQLESLFPHLAQYADDDDIRPGDIREQLKSDGSVEFDINLGAGRLINPEAGRISNNVRQSLLELALAAIDLHIAGMQANDANALSLHQLMERRDTVRP